ncbi:MAG: beta-mannanase [Armatimonadota bacterium]|nr:MAG: beta-mannanase [Armatimonadota bacterium]
MAVSAALTDYRWPLACAAALVALLVSLGAGGCETDERPGSQLSRVAPPAAGKLYHGVYPGGTTGEEDDITREQVESYERAVGKNVAWVAFSHNWYRSTAFPRETAEWIREMGSLPYVRLMLREEENRASDRFSLEAVLQGRLDAQLRAWGRGAREFGTPLIVEFGTECNGEWFPWNGLHHGAGRRDGFGDPGKPDGPERFAAAYRHIVEVVRGEGASNITWVFHVDATDDPDVSWNRFENYYPGDEYVDWVGVSAYGPQQPTDDEAESFREQMDGCYPRLERLAKTKPVIVAEFGCTAGSPAARPEKWAAAALDGILGGRWPRVMGFSWWNERWENDDNPEHDTTMRVEDTPALAAVFSEKLAGAAERIRERPDLVGSG